MDVSASLALLALLTATGLAAQQPSQVDTTGPAARRATELVRLIDTGDRAAARKYAQHSYAPQFLTMAPMDVHLGHISRLHDQTRGVELHGFQQATATEATALLKSKLTGGWQALFVQVEPEPPHRIAGLGLRRPQPPADAQLDREMTDAERVRELETFVDRLAGADAFSGAVLLARHGKPLFQKAYGQASKEFGVPNRVDTKFNLGSMNKMFTAVAIAQLAEQGKLSFEDPLSKFLPDFPDAETASKIRIKHLLTHTSGLGSYFNQQFRESSRARWRTVDDMMQLARGDSAAFEPGTRSAYSNTGFLVLGKVIEKVTGQSYYDYVRENIFRPAGMTSTDSYELDRVTPNLALGYEKEFTDQGVSFRNNLFQHVIRGGPAGGGYSTVEDLLRFDQALRANKLVGPEYVQLLLSAKPELHSARYGYGFGVDPERGIAGHSGGFPGISSNLDMFLGSGYTAVVLSNYGGGSMPVVQKIQDLVPS